jgi:DNA adenine methylase
MPPLRLSYDDLGTGHEIISQQEGKMSNKPLQSPFPYFGGKSRIASLVWERFGDVKNYVEPFFGSGAVLLARPHWPFQDTRIETVNDLDGMIANFWRALSRSPDEVAYYADWPVNECDLHARHQWLINEGLGHVERLKTDPDYYDPKIAGWWVWGICQWIGSGWCKNPDKRRPNLGDGGKGVHRVSHQHGKIALKDYFQSLADRLRYVRVCCGNWTRVCGAVSTVNLGLTGAFLDPPYDQSQRYSDIYSVETQVSREVREWCLAHGDDARMRIALCGYEGEGHEVLESHGWVCVPWKTSGGYSLISNKAGLKAGLENAKRERIWFSPHCLAAETKSKS